MRVRPAVVLFVGAGCLTSGVAAALSCIPSNEQRAELTLVSVTVEGVAVDDLADWDLESGLSADLGGVTLRVEETYTHFQSAE